MPCGSDRAWPAALRKIRIENKVVCEYPCRKTILDTLEKDK